MTGFDAPTILDGRLIRRCLESARVARDQGDVAVGALVAWKGRVVAEAGERVPASGDPTAHADLLAIRKARRKLGARELAEPALSTSAEPCIMCSYGIREARIGRMAMGARTPDVGGVTSRYPILIDPDLAGWSSPPAIVRDVWRDERTAIRGG